MKKIYILLSVLALAFSVNAQTIPTGDMEMWRTNSAGSTNPKIVRAPHNWYGADSLIIGIGQVFGTILSIPDTVWRQQLFKDSAANAHGGTYSAKLVTRDQDTLGIFPGVMSNAQANVDLSTFAVTFSGGLSTTLRTTSVSAWVKYEPASAVDSANIMVQAYGTVDGIDSLLGYGYLKIGATPTFTQVTANVIYPNPSLIVETLRITFASSSDTAAEYSTLWVDDVSAVGVAQPISVNDVNKTSISVFPNPATDVLYISGAKHVTCNIVAIDGTVVATQNIDQKGSIDLTTLASGMYLYTLTENGKLIQKGQVSIAK